MGAGWRRYDDGVDAVVCENVLRRLADWDVGIPVDDKATAEQRDAIEALWTGEHGGPFAIWTSVTPNRLGVTSAPIEFHGDREARTARLTVSGVGETEIAPIKNPVTGDEHRAQIHLPNGFEYELAEMGNTVACSVKSNGVEFALESSYAQLNRVEWSA